MDHAREAVVKEGVRVLKSGGQVVVCESDGEAFLSRIFQRVSPVEAGMINSTPEKLLKLGRMFGESSLSVVEVSFMVRAFGYYLGWPDGWMRVLFTPAYMLARGWERILELLLPKGSGIYLMLRILKG